LNQQESTLSLLPSAMSDPASPFRHPVAWLRNKFLAGLALVIPMMVTIWILKIIHDFLHNLSTPLLLPLVHIFYPEMSADDPAFEEFTSFVGFLLPVLVVLALGVLATNVIGSRLVVAMDQLVLRIPVISFIYKSLKQVIEAFRGFGGSRNFKRVVYIEYPSPGMRLIGFVTGQFADPKTGASMSCVFMPGALSPMTGLLIVTETAKLVDAPLSIEEAMKMIFSGGLIGPGADKKGKPSRSKTPATITLPVASADFAHLPTAEDQPEVTAGVGVPVVRG
jgi:uncharacterized membrane protein